MPNAARKTLTLHTVRSGLARIAGATAVELLAALVQHSTGAETPTPESDGAGAPAGSGALGGVPHMLRGQLTGFSQAHMQGCAHDSCTACSRAVVDAYRTSGWDFVLAALRVRCCRLPSGVAVSRLNIRNHVSAPHVCF